MNRDELKEKIRQALRSKGEEFTVDSTAGHFLWSHSYEAAEACLSAIEQSGYVIVSRESVKTAYEAMQVLSSSPFNTQGDEVSCNRPEQAEQSVSPEGALQTNLSAEAAPLWAATKAVARELWPTGSDRPFTDEAWERELHLLDKYRDEPDFIRGNLYASNCFRIAVAALKAANSQSQIEEPRSGDTDPST